MAKLSKYGKTFITIMGNPIHGIRRRCVPDTFYTKKAVAEWNKPEWCKLNSISKVAK